MKKEHAQVYKPYTKEELWVQLKDASLFEDMKHLVNYRSKIITDKEWEEINRIQVGQDEHETHTIEQGIMDITAHVQGTARRAKMRLF